MAQGPVYLGTGRRKSSVARVRLMRGTGNIKINGTDAVSYFPHERSYQHAVAPLHATKMVTKYDVIVRCNGGGFNGQAGALRLGIARAHSLFISWSKATTRPLEVAVTISMVPSASRSATTKSRMLRVGAFAPGPKLAS